MSRFRRTFTATAADIDELGHVNNAVWVEWIQALAVAHWEAVAPADQQAAYIWVVTRHEIDYRGNLREGEAATGEIGRAHVWTPVPNAHLVCRLLLEKKQLHTSGQYIMAQTTN